jgi:hypothetical protein
LCVSSKGSHQPFQSYQLKEAEELKQQNNSAKNSMSSATFEKQFTNMNLILAKSNSRRKVKPKAIIAANKQQQQKKRKTIIIKKAKI